MKSRKVRKYNYEQGQWSKFTCVKRKYKKECIYVLYFTIITTVKLDY